MDSQPSPPRTQEAPRRLRVLCLHSWRTSADVFKEQWRRAGLDVQLQDLLELVFISAPNPASGPIPDDVAGTFEGPYFEWFSTDKAQGGEELVFSYSNLLKSEAWIMDAVRRLGPFDGICGFSQGGAMASVTAALCAAGLALQDVPPFKFALFFGAVMLTHPRYMQALTFDRVAVPSVHIIGHKDYVKDHAIRLARVFEAPMVLLHTRGHIVPPLPATHLAALRAFLSAVQQQDPVATLQQQRQRQAAARAALEPLDSPAPMWEQQQQQPYTQRVKLDGQIGRIPQLASKL